MKISNLLLICCLSMTMAFPQFRADARFPQITVTGGGMPKHGFINLDARQQIWQSANKRHSFDASGGYSRNWGDPNPRNNLKDYRVGAGYTFRF